MDPDRLFPDDFDEKPHAALLNDDYEPTGTSLHYSEGKFYLHIRIKAEMDAPVNTISFCRIFLWELAKEYLFQQVTNTFLFERT